MRKLSRDEQMNRGWYYVNKDKYYCRSCDYCNKFYDGMGKNYCGYSCVRKANPIIMKGEDSPMVKNPEIRLKLSQVMNGRKPSPQTVAASIKAHKGFYGKDAKNGRWIEDRSKVKSTINTKFRSRTDWKEWREFIFKRDGYKCLDCGLNGQLEPHHIIPLKISINGVFDVNNGVTLCRKCHQNTFGREVELVNTYKSLLPRTK